MADAKKKKRAPTSAVGRQMAQDASLVAAHKRSMGAGDLFNGNATGELDALAAKHLAIDEAASAGGS